MKNFLCVFILGFIVTTKPVQAGSWFVGASTLLVETDTGITHILGNATIEEESAGYKVFFGWEIIDNLSIEGFYADYGDFVLTGNRGAIVLIGGDYYSFNANNVKSTTSTTGFGVNVKYGLPVSDDFDIYAQLGVFSWSLEQTTTGSGLRAVKVSDTGESATVGVGSSYSLSEQFKAFLSYELTKINGRDIKVTSAGVSFNF